MSEQMPITASTPSPTPSKAKNTLGLIGVVLLFIGGGLFVYWQVNDRDQLQSKFAPYNQEYLALRAKLNAYSGDPYIRGKAVTVNIGDIAERNAGLSNLDDPYWNFPSNLQAKEPTEVGTIILLDWKREEVGEYKDGSKGYVAICRLTVIDKVANYEVASKEFRGEDPPQAKSGFGKKDVFGTFPNDAITDYIRSLPTKP